MVPKFCESHRHFVCPLIEMRTERRRRGHRLCFSIPAAVIPVTAPAAPSPQRHAFLGFSRGGNPRRFHP